MVWAPFAVIIAMGEGEVQTVRSVIQVTRQHDSGDNAPPVLLEDVEVLGRRGTALLAPEVELDGAEIDALHVWEVGDVLQRLRETWGLGDQPMVLINGKRTPNAGVFYGFPPEALARAEILPAGAGALYGAAPGQRVVNLVLQPQFSSHDGRIVGSRPTQGGASSLAGELRRSSIAGRNTHQAAVGLSRDTALRADERDHHPARDGREGSMVTLRAPADATFARINLTRALGDWSGVFSLDGQAQRTRSVARAGDIDVENHRHTAGLAATAGLGGPIAGWSIQASLAARASRSREAGLEDRLGESRFVGLTASASRAILELPAGPAAATLSGGFSGSRTEVERDGNGSSSHFSTRDVRAAFAIPLTKASMAQGRIIGDLLVSVGAGLRHTGAGDGDDLNAGLAWTPRKGLRVNGDWSVSTAGLSELQRLEPRYFGAPVVVFDLRVGEAVTVVPIRGGNPDLRQPRSERFVLNTFVGPFTRWSVTGNVGFERAETADLVGILPALTQDVEAAFPDRFLRDAEGRLTNIDYRPLNLASTLTQTLTTGLNFSLPRPPSATARETTVMRVGINHRLQLENRLMLRPGLPLTDRLKGDGGGVSAQGATVMVDAQRGRWGFNTSARWEDGYRTRRTGGVDGPDDLVAATFVAVDLRLSLQVASAASGRSSEESVAPRRAGGLQVSLEVENLLDARRRYRLGNGRDALGYGRDVVDPMGRTIRLTLQRRF
jgi:hypothetical protein